MSIPVQRDGRTFEERRRELLDNLEKKLIERKSSEEVNNVSSSSGNSSIGVDSTAAGGNSTEVVGGGGSHDIWDREISQWILESRSKWDDEIQRLRKEFFNLESNDNNSLLSSSSFDNWPSSSQFGGFRDLNSQNFMQENRSLLQQMSSTSISSQSTSTSMKSMSSTSTSSSSSSSSKNINSSIISSSSSTSSSSSSQFSSSSTSSQLSSSTLLGGSGGSGLLTSTSGQQQLTNNKFDDFLTNKSSSALLPSEKSNQNAFTLSKDLYEVGEDGELHFKVRFDAKDFTPEDIQVTTMDNRLMVKAKAEKKTENSSSYKEFSRTVDLPDSINHAKFQCHLTKDGVLVIDAPVIKPDYESISYSHQGELGIKPRSSQLQDEQKQLSITGQNGPNVVVRADGKKVVHLELPVDSTFEANDIHVRAEGNKIYIEGRHEEKIGGRSSMREFSKYYEVPEALDPLSMSALLKNGVLIIEAPLH